MAAHEKVFPSLLILILVIIGAHGDSTTKTMEEFSGYPSESDACDAHSPSFYVDNQSLQRQIDELAGFADTPPPSVTRILYSENDVLSRRYIKNLMEMSGLSVREDVVGNIYTRNSHKAQEYSAIEYISNEVKVLALTLAKLSLS